MSDAVDFAGGAAEVAFAKLDSDKSGGISLGELWPMVSSGDLAKAMAESAGSMDVGEAAKAAEMVKKTTRCPDAARVPQRPRLDAELGSRCSRLPVRLSKMWSSAE